ncbi:PAS domain-containing sensor histidine kinase [Legionella sp. D16C41]|uniref:PAS domain-containing sensor histidine kinase n=1 Tax=Legionella sp. D16C41 TaxID=3402688 RepID=UPI003AF98C5B
MDFDNISALKKIINEKELEIKSLKNNLEFERKQFQNNLQDLQDYYESILALMPGHVYWLDRNNVFLGCNDLQARNARLVSRKDIVGKTNYDMPWCDQAEELNRVNNLVMESGEPHITEEYAVMANGMTIYLSNKTPLRNKNNQVIGVLGVSIDITERKKMEVALRRAKERAELANQIKTEFIANIGHDILEPLKGICALSTHLETQVNQLQARQQACWIKKSSVQLLRIIEQISDNLVIEQANNNELNQEVADLNKIVEDIYQLYYPAIKMKNLDFYIEIEACLPIFLTDRVKLHRILMNLITNALSYTQSGSITLKIETLVQDLTYIQLKFSIIDTGNGIPCEIQNYLNNVNFAQISHYDSFGQNLCIAQKYIGLLGGELNILSEPGQGSIVCFTVFLKVKD